MEKVHSNRVRDGKGSSYAGKEHKSMAVPHIPQCSENEANHAANVALSTGRLTDPSTEDPVQRCYQEKPGGHTFIKARVHS